MEHRLSNSEITPIKVIPFEPLGDDVTQTMRRVPLKLIFFTIFLLCCAAFVSFTILARAVVFELNPKNARINIQSLLTFNIGDNYLILEGAHKINASAEGYLPLETTVNIGSEKNQVLALELNPLPGVATFSSNIEKTDVYLGERLLGHTDEKIADLPIGKQRFGFKKARYLDQTLELDIKGYGEEQSFDITLQPAWGITTIQSDPSNASVSVDGEVIGNTPIDIEVLESGTEVIVSSPNYQSWKQILSAVPSATSQHPLIRLEKIYAKFAIASQPTGANLTVNGEFKGTTPTSIELPADAKHTIKLFQKGYETLTKKVTGKSGSQADLDLKLTPIYGTISLHLSPADSSITIDGKPYRGDRSNIRLQVLPHQIQITREDYVSQQKQLTPTANKTQIVDIELYTAEDARFAKLPKQYRASIDIEFRLMRPKDTFYLGAPRREPGRRANETQRKVMLDQALYVGLYEITNAQYKEFDPEHNSRQVAGQSLDLPNYPVVNVSWQDAALFCNWLSEQDGFTPYYQISDNGVMSKNEDSNGYRLPTEAEWAWLARIDQGESLRYSWGSSFPPNKVVANFNDLSASNVLGSPIANYQDTFPVAAPVGSFPANHNGVFDIDGNVSEWTNDYYEVGITHLGDPLVNPQGPETGTERVIRGASWKHSGRSQLRLSYRNFGTKARDDIGFRIVRPIN